MTVAEYIRCSVARAECLARKIIPELSGIPLYVIQPRAGTMVSPDLLGDVSGQFYPCLDQALKPQLELERRWQGPGVAIVVDAIRLFFDSLDDDVAERRVAGVTLHELCHFLDRSEEQPAEPNQYARFEEACVRRKDRVAAGDDFAARFFVHSDQFCRMAAHVWRRAAHHGGCILDARYLNFGSDYPGLENCPSPKACIEALGAELDDSLFLPLRQVRATEPPAAYRELWNPVFEQVLGNIEAITST